jgi:hypothetical protein
MTKYLSGCILERKQFEETIAAFEWGISPKCDAVDVYGVSDFAFDPSPSGVVKLGSRRIRAAEYVLKVLGQYCTYPNTN